MKLYDKQHFSLFVIIILNSILIITVNYVVTKQIVSGVQEKITENEYEKIGGKENYTILKELQKEEALNYVNKLKKEDPALVYKMRQNAIIKEFADKKLLNWEGLNELKSNSFIRGGTGAAITIMEFSDMECSFCKDFHNVRAIDGILGINKDVNYIFKNFPLPTHKNSGLEAKYAKCVEKLGGGEKYLSFIDKVFSSPVVDEKGINEDVLQKNISELSIDKLKFEDCSKDPEIEELVKKEFEQGLKLGIKSTPSNIIINNSTGEYELLAGNSTNDDLITSIDRLSK